MQTGLPPVFRPRDLIERGMSVGTLQSLLRRGEAIRVGRGLYRVRSADHNEHESLAVVTKRVPGAIICLLTALHVHGIGTQAPREVWIAVDRKARRPRLLNPPVRIVRFSDQMLSYSVETRTIMGVAVRMTSPARTVVDCFRYRNKIGVAVAVEALRDLLHSRRAVPGDLLRVAEACRARTVISPYVEALMP